MRKSIGLGALVVAGYALLAACASFSPQQALVFTTQLASTPVLLQQAAVIVSQHSGTWPTADKTAIAQDVHDLTVGLPDLVAGAAVPAQEALSILGRFAQARPAYVDAYRLVKQHWSDFSASEQQQLLATDQHVRALDAAVNAALAKGGLRPADLQNLVLTTSAIANLAQAVVTGQKP